MQNFSHVPAWLSPVAKPAEKRIINGPKGSEIIENPCFWNADCMWD